MVKTGTVRTASNERGGEIIDFIKKVKDDFKKRKVPLTTSRVSIDLGKFEEQEDEKIESTERSPVESDKYKRGDVETKMKLRSKKMKKEQFPTEERSWKKEKERAKAAQKLKKHKKKNDGLQPSAPVTAEKDDAKMALRSKGSTKESDEPRSTESFTVSDREKGNTGMKRVQQKKQESTDNEIWYDHRRFQSVSLGDDDVFEASETVPKLKKHKGNDEEIPKLKKHKKRNDEGVPKLKKHKKRNDRLQPSEPMTAACRGEEHDVKITSRPKRSKKESGEPRSVEPFTASNREEDNTGMKRSQRKKQESEDRKSGYDDHKHFQSVSLGDDDVFEASESYAPDVENEEKAKCGRFRRYTYDVKSDSERESNATEKSISLRKRKYAYIQSSSSIQSSQTASSVSDDKPNPKDLSRSWEEGELCAYNVGASEVDGWWVEDAGSQKGRSVGSDWSVAYSETPVKPSKRNPRASNKRRSDAGDGNVPAKRGKIYPDGSEGLAEKDFRNKMLYATSRILRVPTKKLLKQKKSMN